jgi:hypothetical protein
MARTKFQYFGKEIATTIDTEITPKTAVDTKPG